MPGHITHWGFRRRAPERKMHKCCVWRNLVVPEEILLGTGVAGKEPEAIAPWPATSDASPSDINNNYNNNTNNNNNTSSSSRGRSPRPSLLSLPNEIIEDIFTQLDDNSYDMVCLSLTCRQLLRLSFNRKTSPAFAHRCHGTCINPLKCAGYWEKHRRIINGFREFLVRTHLGVEEARGTPDWPTALCAGCFRWQPLDSPWWEAEIRQFYALDNTGLRYITLNPERYLRTWCSDPEELGHVCPRCGWHQFLDTAVNGSKIWMLLKDRARVGKSWPRDNVPPLVQHWVDMVEGVDEDGDDEENEASGAEGQGEDAVGQDEAEEQPVERQGAEDEDPSAQQAGDDDQLAGEQQDQPQEATGQQDDEQQQEPALQSYQPDDPAYVQEARVDAQHTAEPTHNPLDDDID